MPSALIPRSARPPSPMMGALLASMLVLAAPADARAGACLTGCEAQSTFIDCAVPGGGGWPMAAAYSFTASCARCCEPAHSPVVCQSVEVPLAQLSVEQGGAPVPGAFVPVDTVCGGLPLFLFDGALAPGKHSLVHHAEDGPSSLVTFVVFEDGPPSPACQEDTDCKPCDVCVEGTCLAVPGAPVCLDDADCGDGETCHIVPGAWCQNACALGVGGDECTEDAGCSGCDTCDDGVCVEPASYEPLCATDADCEAGLHCVVFPLAPCQNFCTPQSLCARDSDCGPCSVCISGLCYGDGKVACQTDSDCGAGMRCDRDLASDCHNRCVVVEGGSPCLADADCGACGLCADGVCQPAPSPACTTDADCAPTETCEVDADDPCGGACAPRPECDTDADCRDCAVCTGGMCVPTPGVHACDADTDCGEARTCEFDGCQRRCVASSGGGVPATDTPPADLGCASGGGWPGVWLTTLALLALLAGARRRAARPR